MAKILYVKVINRDIVIRTDEGTIEGSITKQLETLLAHYGFARLNQNMVVNLEEVHSFDPQLGIGYFDREKLHSFPISRRNRYKVSTKFDNV